MKFLLKSFCFCFLLRTGTVVIGIFHLLSGVGVLVVHVMVFLSEKFSDGEENTDESISQIGSLLLYFILFIIKSILSISVAVFVLIAAWTNRKYKLLLPWLILNPLWMIAGTVVTFYFAVLHWIGQEIAIGMGLAAASVSIAAIGIFCWLVMFSYYFELREDSGKIVENPENPSLRIVA